MLTAETGKQLSFIHLIPNPFEVKTPIRGERTIINALTDDFPATIQKIRQIYLPQGSVLLVNNHLLEEAIAIVEEMGSLYNNSLTNDPSMNFAIATNLETLKRREIFLNQAKSDTQHPKIAHRPHTPEWENEIRLATDNQFFKWKTTSPEDKPKRTVTWTGASTEAIWQISTLFHPTLSADMADKIIGEDRLTAELFGYYLTFLKRKASNQ